MNAVIDTDEQGAPNRVEANLNVAVRQGRIAFRDVEKWRRTYQMLGYEQTTRLLLDNEPDPNLLASTSDAQAAPPTQAERRAAVSAHILGVLQALQGTRTSLRTLRAVENELVVCVEIGAPTFLVAGSQTFRHSAH